MIRLAFFLLFSTTLYGQVRTISTVHITQTAVPDKSVEVLGKLSFDDTKYSTVEVLSTAAGLQLQIIGQPLMSFSTREMTEEVRIAFLEELRKNKNQPEKNRFKLDKSGNLIDTNNDKILTHANPRILAALREDTLKKFWFPVGFNMMPGEQVTEVDDWFESTPSTINGIPISTEDARRFGQVLDRIGSQRQNTSKFMPHLDAPKKDLIVIEH